MLHAPGAIAVNRPFDEKDVFLGRGRDVSQSLKGAYVVLGVTGSIAAYKAIEVCRRLVDAGAHVAPVFTQSATRFVGAATFSALASERTKTEMFDDEEAIPHTRLGHSADLVLVAPATARIIGEYACGIASDLLSATLLATKAPVVICPAMHKEMWEQQAVQENLTTLRRRGVVVVPPATGRLAGGEVGEGRLAEPEEIVEVVARVLAKRRDLEGLSVLVTAGGTREPIDPVRFIGNRSSGRQGHAIAQAACDRGAAVTLITASDLPVDLGIDVVHVETADELARETLRRIESADLIIMAAAVADFRPIRASDKKLRKRDGTPRIELEATKDVLAEIAKVRQKHQVIIGFAAETDDVLANGARKLKEKNVDLIVVNDVSAPGVGFGHDTNAVTILDQQGHRTSVPLQSKSTIAHAVLDAALMWASIQENPVHEESSGSDDAEGAPE